VTWTITGRTKWYVGVVELATRRDLTKAGDFRPQFLVAYEVLKRSESTGRWTGPRELGPGTYYGRLKLRFGGPCKSACESTTSVRRLEIEPPRLASLEWTATRKGRSVLVAWTPPGNAWFVGMVVVDDDADLSSPADAVVWPDEPVESRWRSSRLAAGTYHVRVHARYAGCATCLWTSRARKVTLG
jgi:hypothetical protein